MMLFLKKAIDFVYAFLFPDAVGEFIASFRYKLITVVLVLILFVVAIYTLFAFGQ